MSWIKQANKIGQYVTTYEGFRIYCKRQPQIHQYTETRHDGKYRITDFIKGEYVAVNGYGQRFAGTDFEAIALKIDIHVIIN